MSTELNWRDEKTFSDTYVDDLHISVVQHGLPHLEKLVWAVNIYDVTLTQPTLVSPTSVQDFLDTREGAKKKALRELLNIFETRAEYYTGLWRSYNGMAS